MSEDVKIHIATDADTRAIADAEARIKMLKTAAAELEKKAAQAAIPANYSTVAKETAVKDQAFYSGHAKKALQEAGELERDILRLKKEQATTEKLITVEQREQSSGLRGGRMGMALRFGGVNMRAAGELGFAVMIGEQIKSAIDAAGDAIQAESLKTQVAITGDRAFDRHLKREKLISGAGARTAFVNSGEDSLDKLTNENAQNDEQIRVLQREKMERLATWGTVGATAGGLLGSVVPGLGTAAGLGVGAALGTGAGALVNHFSTDEQIQQIENRKDINDKQKAELTKAIAEQKKLREQDIADQVSVAEATGRHDMVAVNRLQDKIAWTKKYNEAKKEGASEDQARELAGMEIFNEHQARTQAIAEKLVSASTGAAGTARAAQLADPNSDLRHSIDRMNSNVTGQLRKTHDALTTETFQ